MTLTQVKKIGYDLTGLNITTNKYEKTHFVWQGQKALYININEKQLQNLYGEFEWYLIYKQYGINRKGINLQALLHEIAHYKQHQKIKDFEKKYDSNPKYYENIANRYSTRYYKRFVRNKKVSNMAIDKIKVI